MINLLIWVAYGILVGLISKALYKTDSALSGFVPTLAIGIIGSFVGGFINYLVGNGGPLQPSGIFMGILGGVVTCFLHRKFLK
jgi:uncharacterized membrane protein YeaQ/YmgE (transglycosylase-associated protein family)